MYFRHTPGIRRYIGERVKAYARRTPETEIAIVMTKRVFMDCRTGPKLKFTVHKNWLPVNPFHQKEEQRRKRAQRKVAKQQTMAPEAPGAAESPPMSDLERTWASALKTEQVEALVGGILDDVLSGAIRSVVQEIAIEKEPELTTQEVPEAKPMIDPEEMEEEEIEEGGYSDSQLSDSVK